MASTNKTENYELSQFEGSDKPSWEADYNADMLAIDTNLKAVSDVANGASGDIITLDGRMTTAEGAISTNANDIDALEGRCDNLESGQTSDDSRLDALEAGQIAQNTAIESNTRLGYNLARPYDSASTYAVGDYVLFQDTLYKCTTAVSTGEAFDPTKWLAIKAMDEVNGGAGDVWSEATNFITNATLQIAGGSTYNLEPSAQKAYFNENLFIFTVAFPFMSVSPSVAANSKADLDFTIEVAGETLISGLNFRQFLSVYNASDNFLMRGAVFPSGTTGTAQCSLKNITTAPASISVSVTVSGVIIRK